MTTINKELVEDLDEDFVNIVRLVDYGKKKDIPVSKRDENTKSYDLIASNLKEQVKLIPVKLELTEKEKAK